MEINSMKGHHSAQENDSSFPILDSAGQEVQQLFDKGGDTRLVFHHYPLAAEIAHHVAAICREEKVDTTVQMISGLAGWFAVTGYLSVYPSPFPQSVRMLRTFLDTQTTTADIKERSLACLEALGNNRRPETPEGRIVTDALNMVTYVHHYADRQQLLRLEREFLLDQSFDKREWAKEQLEELLKIRFYTPYGQMEYAPKLAQNILLQKLQLEKQQKNSEDELVPLGAPGHFQHLEEHIPIRSIQTFFRTNYRNHINLSAIADNKANIMISVNTILISVLITALSYQHIAEKNPMVILPVVIFLVTGLASLTFAVLSARPKVTFLNQQNLAPAEVRKNIIFFGNFVSLNLDQYEEAMDAVFRDGELLIGNMTRDLYHLGKVLDKKYRFLSISYNIFMIGFVATVVTFLWTLF